MVVETPAKITPIINKSWLPIPVNLVLEENGVIKVQPATVKVLFEHLAIYTFLRLDLTTRLAAYQKDSG